MEPAQNRVQYSDLVSAMLRFRILLPGRFLALSCVLEGKDAAFTFRQHLKTCVTFRQLIVSKVDFPTPLWNICCVKTNVPLQVEACEERERERERCRS